MENEISYKNLIRCIPNGMFMLDRDMRIVTWNRAAENIFGLKADDVLGKGCAEVTNCDSSGERCPLFDEKKKKPVMGYECRVKVQGREMVLLKNIELLTDPSGDIHGGIETFVEITALKNLEAELASARNMKQSVMMTKREFFANLSHEIRTPMNGIMGLVDLALETRLDEKQREYLENAKRASASLMHLLNDLLDFSKIGTGNERLEIDIFDLEATIHSAVALHMAQIENSGVILQVNKEGRVPAFVHGDSSRLRQVLVNLLSNSLKFTESGTISVSVSVDNSSGGIDGHPVDGDKIFIRFSVSDTGIGIPDGALPSIFDAFTQVDGSVKRGKGGVGLGLSICRHLVEMMGGCIGVQSRIGEGSTFHFTVPMLPADIVHHPFGEEVSGRTMKPVRHEGRYVVGNNNMNKEMCSVSFDDECEKRKMFECLALSVRRRQYAQIERQSLLMRGEEKHSDTEGWFDDLFRIVLAARRKDDAKLDLLLEKMSCVFND